MCKSTADSLLLLLMLTSPILAKPALQEQEITETQAAEKDASRSRSPIPHFTEEVEVVASAPEAAPPVSEPSLFVVEKETIEKVSDYNLTKSFSYTHRRSTSSST